MDMRFKVDNYPNVYTLVQVRESWFEPKQADFRALTVMEWKCLEHVSSSQSLSCYRLQGSLSASRLGIQPGDETKLWGLCSKELVKNISVNMGLASHSFQQGEQF